ncbi:uncharacterized protein C8Q71DRAFT_725300 [Rhodofomes roseus]|uniref:DUF4218 domain-containing protein n=1 Tax=Rhodofomes roseus TaxID=34475 RepID=A0ABQ8K9R1_9APHY|nr:uncharacterized protein C8Q71DRAFT_725300 [Rhodofomes roseus]KAH9834090.1 hypothetical protein C8Q71DRAFT_725300 [Rhodofomes roseus]
MPEVEHNGALSDDVTVATDQMEKLYTHLQYGVKIPRQRGTSDAERIVELERAFDGLRTELMDTLTALRQLFFNALESTKNERRSSEASTSSHAHRIENLRSQIQVLTLEHDILKARQDTDRAAIGGLTGDVATLREMHHGSYQLLHSTTERLDRVQSESTHLLDTIVPNLFHQTTCNCYTKGGALPDPNVRTLQAELDAAVGTAPHVKQRLYSALHDLVVNNNGRVNLVISDAIPLLLNISHYGPDTKALDREWHKDTSPCGLRSRDAAFYAHPLCLALTFVLALAEGPMSSRSKKQKLCLCSKCREFTHDDNGVLRPGVRQDLRAWKAHATEDALLVPNSTARYENAVLLASESFGEASASRESVPTRPRDQSHPSTPMLYNAAHHDHGVMEGLDSDEDEAMEVRTQLGDPDDHDDAMQGVEYTGPSHSNSEPGIAVPLPPPQCQKNDAPREADFAKLRDSLSSKQHTLLALPPLGHRDADRRLEVLIEKLSERRERLSAMEASAWEIEKIMAGLYRLPDQGQVCTPKVYESAGLHAVRRALPPFLLITLLMVSALHTISGLNREAANLILATLRALLFGAFIACSAPHGRRQLTSEQQAILDSIPRDIRSVMSQLKVEPSMTKYAACPSCSCIYAPDHTNADNPYPVYCTFTETDRPPCGTLLVKKARTSTHNKPRVSYSPLRPYPYHSIFSWVAALFARHDLEEAAESAWVRSKSSDGKWTDILQAPALQSFCGPNRELFSKQPHTDVHLVFGLYLDWFNPGGNKKAGKSQSLGAIYLAAGFAGHSSKHFCSFCLLKRSDINNISRPWPSRTWDEHFDIARRWRDAVTAQERDALFEEHGLRWSELLRLPYWDPTRFAVVDAMHNLFLGELRHHCMSVWGIDVKDHQEKHGKAVKKTLPHTPEEQQKNLDKLLQALRKGVVSAVMQPRKGYLVALAQLNKISPTSLTKRAYATALLERCLVHGADSLLVPPVLDNETADFHLANGPYDISKFRVLTQDVINQIRHDIKTTYLPSWLERPPSNFGSASHGKLKADHWRTVCTINMVITLVRIWGASTASKGEHRLLENFIHLVIAVELASRRSMDAGRARLFDHHMFEYLRTLRDLFENNLVPNHHLSLHLSTCLQLFGPVHGWWAYPFERFNGIIQRLSTNNQIDKIPLTYMRVFHAAANLRWRFASTEWPESEGIPEVLKAFTDVYNDAARGTRAVDILVTAPSSYDDLYRSMTDSRLDEDIYGTLITLLNTAKRTSDFVPFYSGNDDRHIPISPFARVLPKVNVSGITYGTRTGNIRNSFHAAMDPYRKFPLLNTQLHYNRFSERRAVIRADDVITHFASLVYNPQAIGESCIVVRSLDRDTTGGAEGSYWKVLIAGHELWYYYS